MSAIAEAPIDALSGDRLAKRNALVLAVGQALAGGNNTVIVATASILGSMLAPDKSLATLPISMMVVGIWAGTLPVGFLAKRYGRRTAYVSASVCGALAGLIGYAAVIQGELPRCFCWERSSAGSMRPRTCRTASARPTRRAPSSSRRRSPG